MKGMKIYLWIGLVLILTALLPGCGDSDSAAVPPPAATVEVTSSRTLAVADNADSVTIMATVRKLDGSFVGDGTNVNFAVSGVGGNLSAPSALTTGGLATVTLTHAPIAGGNNHAITVTCTALGGSGSTNVTFINQPASAEVLISFNQVVSDLAALQFVLNNTAGATFDNAAQNIAAVGTATGSFASGGFDAPTSSTTIGLINAAGFNADTNPIIRVTYDVTAGLPAFAIDEVATFVALDSGGLPISPAVTAGNLAVAVTFNTEP